MYLDALVLEGGVILADLPGNDKALCRSRNPLLTCFTGFRDVNREREKRAEQYLLQCDEVFVVAPIARVVSNLGVDRFIREYSKRRSTSAQSRNVVVICTHAEVSG